MAAESGGGGGSKKLSPWTSVPKSAPDKVVGTRSFSGPAPRGPVPGAKFDPSRLQKVTTYAPSAAPARVSATTSPRTADAVLGVSQNFPAADAQILEQPKQEKVEQPVRKTYQLTWDEYNSLSEDQRAAVDYNTLLVKAREKDLGQQEKYKPKPEQQQFYNEEVRRVFGEGKGSETHAPETMGVLKQLDFTGRGEDLDDFLSLDQAITAKELRKLNLDIPDPVKTSLPEAISAITNLRGGEQATYKVTNRLAEAMARAGDVLATFRGSAARNRNDDVLAMGGTYNRPGKAPAGYREVAEGQEDLNSFIQKMFFVVSHKDSDQAEVDTWVDWAAGFKPGEKRKLLQYFDEQTRTHAASGVGLGKGKKSAEEVRRLIGLDKGGERDAR